MNDIDSSKDPISDEGIAEDIETMKILLGDLAWDEKKRANWIKDIIAFIFIAVPLTALYVFVTVEKYNESYHNGWIIAAGVIGVVALLLNIVPAVVMRFNKIVKMTKRRNDELKNQRDNSPASFTSSFKYTTSEQRIDASFRSCVKKVCYYIPVILLALVALVFSLVWFELDSPFLQVASLFSAWILFIGSMNTIAEDVDVIFAIRKHKKEIKKADAESDVSDKEEVVS